MKYFFFGMLCILCSCRTNFFVPDSRTVKVKTGIMLFYIESTHYEDSLKSLTFEERRNILAKDTNLMASLFFEGRLKDSAKLRTDILSGKKTLDAVELGTFRCKEINFEFGDTVGFDSHGMYLTLPVGISYVVRTRFDFKRKITRVINNTPILINISGETFHIVQIDPVTEKMFNTKNARSISGF